MNTKRPCVDCEPELWVNKEKGSTVPVCSKHYEIKKSNTNNLLNAHFEEQRINDLKIDIDAVLEEVWRMYENEPDTDEAIWLMSLNNKLKRLKTLL